MPMNLIEKIHAIMTSHEVNIWHFFGKKDPPRFYYWLRSEPDNELGHGCNTLEELIEEAYAKIDPLLAPLPPALPQSGSHIRLTI